MLVPIIETTNEFFNTPFTVTTQNLGVPIAQLLFPGIRKPMVIIEDPREIEDIMVRRDKDFDKTLVAINMFCTHVPKFNSGSVHDAEAQEAHPVTSNAIRLCVLYQPVPNFTIPCVSRNTIDGWLSVSHDILISIPKSTKMSNIQ